MLAIYGLMLVCTGLARPRVRAVTAVVLAWVAGGVLRIRRRGVTQAMRRAGIPLAPAVMYRTLAYNLIDLFAVWGARPGASLPVALSGELERAVAEIRGPFVVASGHCGQFEAAAYVLARARPTAAIVHRPSALWLRRWLSVQRTRFQLEELAGPGALLDAAWRLGEGTCVCTVIDQVPPRAQGAMRGAFLGADAWLDRAAFVLAARARCPVLLVATTSMRAGHSEVQLLRQFAPAADRAAVSRQVVEANALLETHIRAHPAEWLWLHRRWREPLEPQALV
jgi:Kdo2-lipid IVA lauroyltransferase/acyltransferase